MRRLLSFLCLASMACLAPACGDDDDGDSRPSPTATAATPSATPSAAPSMTPSASPSAAVTPTPTQVVPTPTPSVTPCERDQCGGRCGECGEFLTCEDNRCACVENCEAREESCADCGLSLVLAEPRVRDGRLRGLTLHIDYAPEDGDPRPRLAELRIASNRDFEVDAATLGPALDDAGKSLASDPDTGERWFRTRDGDLRLVVLSTANTNDIGPGRWVTVELRLNSPGPSAFWLRRRDEVLAPGAADQQLQRTPYDTPVVAVP